MQSKATLAQRAFPVSTSYLYVQCLGYISRVSAMLTPRVVVKYGVDLPATWGQKTTVRLPVVVVMAQIVLRTAPRPSM